MTDIIKEFDGTEVTGWDSVPDWVQPDSLIPPTKKVRFIIVKVKDQESKNGGYFYLNVQFNIVDGIDEYGKYKNKAFFERLCRKADKATYNSDFFKANKHLSQLKQVVNAVGAKASPEDVESLISQLEYRELYADIIQKPDVDAQGNPKTVNALVNFRAI